MAYQALFPGARDVLEPHFRTQRLLSQYQEASKGSAFLKLLSLSGKAFERTGCAIDGIEI